MLLWLVVVGVFMFYHGTQRCLWWWWLPITYRNFSHIVNKSRSCVHHICGDTATAIDKRYILIRNTGVLNFLSYI